MTICEYQKLDKMEKRLRLRDWLETKISDPLYPGLIWLNEQKKIFRIPWKHGGRHGWREDEDARLFREWSEHTGASPRDIKQHKANFRCALNSLRDVKQLQTLNKRKGDDAYRVYQMLPKVPKKKTTVWIKKRKQNSPTSKNEDRMGHRRCRRNLLSSDYSDSQHELVSPRNDWQVMGYEDVPRTLQQNDYDGEFPDAYPISYPGNNELSGLYYNQPTDQPCPTISPTISPHFRPELYPSYPRMVVDSQEIPSSNLVPEYAVTEMEDLPTAYAVNRCNESCYDASQRCSYQDGNPEDNDSVFAVENSSPRDFSICYPCFDPDFSSNHVSLSPNSPWRGSSSSHTRELPDYSEDCNPIGQHLQVIDAHFPSAPPHSALPSASTLLSPLENECATWTCQGTPA